jgi:hypothetical protein
VFPDNVKHTLNKVNHCRRNFQCDFSRSLALLHAFIRQKPFDNNDLLYLGERRKKKEGKPNDCGFSFSSKSNATADQNTAHLIRLRESFQFLESQHFKAYLQESKKGTCVIIHQSKAEKLILFFKDRSLNGK